MRTPAKTGSFSRRVRAFAAEIPEKSNFVKQEFAKEFLSNVVPNTPVDTGKARSNWNVGIVAQDRTERETDGRSGDKTLQRGFRKIKQARPGQTIHVTNPLPYIQRLNEGWSKQQPAGFIKRSTSAARALIKRIRLRADRKYGNGE